MEEGRSEWLDLRSHLAVLRDAGLMIELDRAVDPSSEAAWLMADLGRRKLAGLFSSVKGSSIPLVFNVLGTREMVALALGTSTHEVTAYFAEKRAQPVAPEQMSGTAPVQEVVRGSEELDLRSLPLVTHSEGDAGAYLTAGLVICEDPETGKRNVSVNRIMPVDATEGAIRMMPPQQLGQIHAKAEKLGRDLPIVIALGMHPTAVLAAATGPPLGVDELSIAGGLRGTAVPMVPGVSVPLDVPAEAEIVIEGWVRGGVRAPEGPFGDFLDYYVPELPNHRFRVTALTHRSEPLYQTMHAGSAEDVCILGLSREAEIAQAVAETGADVTAVRLRPTILGAAISLRTRYDGEGKAVAMAAFGRYRWLKYCVVVDADVDVEDDADLWWAIATRADLEHDVVTIPNAGGFPRDEGGMHNAKLLIDATAPVNGGEAFRRRRPPGPGPLRLEDYASALQVST